MFVSRDATKLMLENKCCVYSELKVMSDDAAEIGYYQGSFTVKMVTNKMSNLGDMER